MALCVPVLKASPKAYNKKASEKIKKELAEKKVKNEIIYAEKASNNEVLRPVASAKIPPGISNRFLAISRIAYKTPIWVNVIPSFLRNRIRNGSKSLRFFKNP